MKVSYIGCRTGGVCNTNSLLPRAITACTRDATTVTGAVFGTMASDETSMTVTTNESMAAPDEADDCGAWRYKDEGAHRAGR